MEMGEEMEEVTQEAAEMEEGETLETVEMGLVAAQEGTVETLVEALEEIVGAMRAYHQAVRVVS